MKKVFSKLMMLAMIVATFSFSACGGSDDENSSNNSSSNNGSNNNSSNNNSSSNSNDSNTTPITKQLIRITRGNEIIDYTYDNLGRVTQIQSTTIGNPKVSRTYTYENNLIIETIFDMGTNWDNKYTLENGIIVKAFDGDTKKTTIYTYDNGYLSKESESNNHNYDYIWQDGNLMSFESDSGTKETYEYTNIVAPQGFFCVGKKWGIRSVWGMGYYFGKSSQYLPASYREGDIYVTYDWTITDGLPTKMVHDAKVAPSTGITTYTFEWK